MLRHDGNVGFTHPPRLWRGFTPQTKRVPTERAGSSIGHGAICDAKGILFKIFKVIDLSMGMAHFGSTEKKRATMP